MRVGGRDLGRFRLGDIQVGDMSKTIVERLRDGAPCFPDPCVIRTANSCLCAEAARKIEVLEDDYAQLLQRWKEEQKMRLEAEGRLDYLHQAIGDTMDIYTDSLAPDCDRRMYDMLGLAYSHEEAVPDPAPEVNET